MRKKTLKSLSSKSGKIISKTKSNISKEPKKSKESTPSILSMGIISLTFRISFSDEDLEKIEEKTNNNDNNDNNENKSKSYYNIDDFKSIKDLKFLEERKEVWDKFELIPKNTTLEHLLLANSLRKKKIITEYIGFGRPCFTGDEKFFEEIFNHISKKYNILFNKTPLDKKIECDLNFEFIHKRKSNNFEVHISGEGPKDDNNEKNQNKNKEKNFPNFSRSDSFFGKMRPENSKYNLFYLNYEDLNEFPDNYQEMDLIELLYYLKKRGSKIFINFCEKERTKEDDHPKEKDNDIQSEHFISNSINYIEEPDESSEDDKYLPPEQFSSKMNNINNIYYLTDLYFFDTKQAPKEFNKHYNYFTADQIKTTVNKGNLYDYFIKGISTGTKDQVEKEKYGFFIEYFNKLYIIRADKNVGNKYEFDLKIYPQINHYNMKIINQYRNIIKRNKNFYVSLILAFILGSIIENNSTSIDTLFKGYATGLEVIKKKIELEKNNIDIKDINFMNINISNNDVEIKVKTLGFTGQENGFILDCTNKEKSELKEYVPLYDNHMINFLANNKNQEDLKKKGFINNKGFIMIDPQYKNRMKDDAQVNSYDKKEFNKAVVKNIRNINVTLNLTDKIKDPRKEALQVNIPTKKKLPIGILSSKDLYDLSSTNIKEKRKSLKRNIKKKYKTTENIK